ncbi:hypothetical protein EY695_02110 [Enterococcus faecalis]|uniref:hypothetical protein n=1 Tax=Enterococcus faecalis TaxID=1351 RepID=UPI001AD64E83|nr:hypothetical protein [Enterococcus faecalis]EJW9248675.1 hypothetical protein [Enterococcus faecalis]MBO6342175.1 hypothetical protein [Enterococcus faecalis]MBO6361612.1 hypothetical protein [Enterococcus faecalis]
MEWWQLWIPFGGTIAGIFANVYINYRQTNKNEELQKEITQKQIDANLKAKARIEWIALVRGLVSEYISNYYKITVIIERVSKEENSMIGNLNGLRIQLGLKEEEKSNNAQTYAGLVEKNKDEITRLKKELNESVSNSISISEQIFLLFADSDEHKQIRELFTSSISFLKEINVSESYGKENEVLKKLDENSENIVEIRNYISVYLKIEWDKAKEGK